MWYDWESPISILKNAQKLWAILRAFRKIDVDNWFWPVSESRDSLMQTVARYFLAIYHKISWYIAMEGGACYEGQQRPWISSSLLTHKPYQMLSKTFSPGVVAQSCGVLAWSSTLWVQFHTCWLAFALVLPAAPFCRHLPWSPGSRTSTNATGIKVWEFAGFQDLDPSGKLFKRDDLIVPFTLCQELILKSF